MDSYLYQVHNLKNDTRFLKLTPGTRSAIITLYKDTFSNLNNLEKDIIDESSAEVLSFIKEHLDVGEQYHSTIFTTKSRSFVEDIDFNCINSIIDFKRVNNIRDINGLFSAVNSLLPDKGLYLGRLETYWERKLLIYRKFGRNAGRFFWLCDFVLNRVIPRIPYLESVYFYLTRGEFHSISRAEVLGRLVYCGFEIIDFRVIRGLSYFVARKTKAPNTFQYPSFYPVVKLQRVGKNGKMIGVYKFRTMHPYSEYLQDYVVRQNGYNDKGKPAGDFRLTRWGKLFRRLWLDELPQLINVLKGEMKLVGLRPLSQVRFNEFPEDLKRERIKFKPGCFPPYVALNMPDEKGNIEAERIYIADLARHPYLTDLSYMLKSVYNILANKIRSS